MFDWLRQVFAEYTINRKRSSKWELYEKSYRNTHYQCASCGTLDKVQVHHKKPFHLYPSLELDPDNFISLCMGENKCHLMLGHGDDFGAYNPNIDIDVTELKRDFGAYDRLVYAARKNRIKG